MSDIAELRRRVAAATGPDRELDYALALHFGNLLGREGRWWGKLRHGDYPLFTSSVDAALALAAKMLSHAKGYEIIALESGQGVQAAVEDEIQTAPTAPLAILSALLAALYRDESPALG